MKMDVSRGLLEQKAGNQVGSRPKRLKPGDIDGEPVAQLGRVGSNPTPGAKKVFGHFIFLCLSLLSY